MTVLVEAETSTEPTPEIGTSKSDLTDKDRADLQNELKRLGGELKLLGQQIGGSIAPLDLDLSGTSSDQPTTAETVSRVQSIQKRMREIQRLFPGQTRRIPPLSKAQITARIETLRTEIGESSQGIEALAKSNPGAEEVRVLQRQLRHKQRTLNWLLGQQRRFSAVASSKNNAAAENPAQEKTVTVGTKEEDAELKSAQTYELIEATEFDEATGVFDLKELDFFKLHHILATEAIEVITPFLSPDNTAIVADLNTNSIIVKDLPHVLLDIDRILVYIDRSVTTQPVGKKEVDHSKEK
ncbi:MAG: hypothetical protein QGI86_08805 [Candidatus Poribacteria bacterium]|jgi:hypothetical protein|nr:hypothetical protein [Candidatus Poribacteria bacterium]MDP6747498.1 hypothetical protein [Candidatus Poribacteria bacterium]MDP6996584.1 hypothetical protein [Candidatus Poribacteria bacterium]MDP7278430.1 hypothetical protein [Candidatus Poribacteria bacterium]